MAHVDRVVVKPFEGGFKVQVYNKAAHGARALVGEVVVPRGGSLADTMSGEAFQALLPAKARTKRT